MGGSLVVVAWMGSADWAAVIVFFAAVFGSTAMIEGSTIRPSLARLMAAHRSGWMERMADREMRIADAALLTILHQGAAFFASATLIVIGGVVVMIADAGRLIAVFVDLSEGSAPPGRAVLEAKLLFLLSVLVVAFLKFVWSNRLFGYCAILIGATPQPEEMGSDQNRAAMVRRSAALNTRAGRSFNRGLRLLYFALAALTWLIGPGAMILATALTAGMLYRREFRSATREIIGGSEP